MNRLFTFLCLLLLFCTTKAQLTAPEFHKGKAMLSGKIANYNLSRHTSENYARKFRSGFLSQP